MCRLAIFNRAADSVASKIPLKLAERQIVRVPCDTVSLGAALARIPISAVENEDATNTESRAHHVVLAIEVRYIYSEIGMIYG